MNKNRDEWYLGISRRGAQVLRVLMATGHDEHMSRGFEKYRELLSLSALVPDEEHEDPQ